MIRRSPGLFVGGGVALATILLCPATLFAETFDLPFYENFEPPWPFPGEWHTFDAPANRYTDCPSNWSLPHEDYCPYDPSNGPGIPAPSPNDSWTWGPYKFETWPDLENGGHVFSGQRSGRQPIWDPYWGAIYHIFTPPGPDKDLRLKVQVWDEAGILCDCDEQSQPPGYVCDCNNLPTPRPSRDKFDVNGGIELGSPYRRASYTGDDKEYYFLGVNTHQSWDHYAWATAADGWVVSSVPRTHGWHLMEIVVHPYTGHPGDVEFWMDGTWVADGHRMPGPAGTGADVIYLHLGGDPALITETNVANTFEEFWYDEVALTACYNPRPDVDGDGDVDQTDFAVFQRCWTGPGDPFTSNDGFDGANCQCVDTDGDKDVDTDDFDMFQNCAAGPQMPADPECDG